MDTFLQEKLLQFLPPRQPNLRNKSLIGQILKVRELQPFQKKKKVPRVEKVKCDIPA